MVQSSFLMAILFVDMVAVVCLFAIGASVLIENIMDMAARDRSRRVRVVSSSLGVLDGAAVEYRIHVPAGTLIYDALGD